MRDNMSENGTVNTAINADVELITVKPIVLTHKVNANSINA